MKTKKGKKSTTEPDAAPQGAVALERRRVMVPVERLKAAPWNPRREITPESVADIAASVRLVGLIEPLVAFEDGEDDYTLVAGHRRLAACRLAGLEEVPVEVLDVDPATARRMTLIENLQRRDADPLMESELVGRLVEDGMSNAEIAAETGRGEKWVARRRNLTRLDESWREEVAHGALVSTDALEHVAAYPPEVQLRVLEGQCWRLDRSRESGIAVRWSDLETFFSSETRELKDCGFDCRECRKCPNNTGVAMDLFDYEASGRSKLGRCLAKECFERKRKEAADALVEKAKAEGFTVRRLKNGYSLYNAHEKPEEGDDICYVYPDWNGVTRLKYGKAPEKDAAGGAAAPQDKAAAAEAKREQEAYNAAGEKVAEWIVDKFEDALKARLGGLLGDDFRELLAKAVCDYSYTMNSEETLAFIDEMRQWMYDSGEDGEGAFDTGLTAEEREIVAKRAEANRERAAQAAKGDAPGDGGREEHDRKDGEDGDGAEA